MSRAAPRKNAPPLPVVPLDPLPGTPAEWAGAAGCVLLIMLGALAVFRSRLANVGGNEMTLDRAVFTVVNAITLSGFRLPINPSDLKPVGQLVSYALISLGAAGTLLIGGWTVRRSARFPCDDATITRAVGTLFLFGTIIGAALLIGDGVGLFASLYDATAALGNCGLFLGRLPELTSLRLQFVLLPLALLGGLGVPVLIDLWQSLASRRRPLPHTSAALTATSVVYLLGTAGILITETISGTPFSKAAQFGSSQALNARTLGLPLDAFATLAPASYWIVLLLMACGGVSGGSAGGVKITTVWVAVRGGWNALAGRAVPRIIGLALSALATYGLIVVIATIALSLAEPAVGGERLLYLAVSAASNCGLSRELVNFTGPGLYVLSLTMLLGRGLSLATLVFGAVRLQPTDVAVG